MVPLDTVVVDSVTPAVNIRTTLELYPWHMAARMHRPMSVRLKMSKGLFMLFILFATKNLGATEELFITFVIDQF